MYHALYSLASLSFSRVREEEEVVLRSLGCYCSGTSTTCFMISETPKIPHVILKWSHLDALTASFLDLPATGKDTHSMGKGLKLPLGMAQGETLLTKRLSCLPPLDTGGKAKKGLLGCLSAQEA